MNLIDRNKVIEKLNILRKLCPDLRTSKMKRDLLHDIEQLPIIEAEPKWIPCSERLPDEGMDSDEDDIVTVLVATRFEGNLWFNGEFYMDVVDYDLKEKSFILEERMRAVAWMPLPEPYKGE